MSEPRIYNDIVSGKAGIWAAPIRSLLRACELVYSTGISLRNARYDRRAAGFASQVPVISVGNITVGGTGKTPFVIELANRLDRLGRSPTVIARGYGARTDGPNDEELLIRRRCPGASYISDPNRCRAAQRAVERMGADVIVLDDAFQHRRLLRDLDIVLIDAMCPFGFGHVLPRGLLREPPSSLKRAHLIVITRCDRVSANELSRIQERLREFAPDTTVLRCRHRVTGFTNLDGSPNPEPVTGKKAVLFAAIGSPQAFMTTVASEGVEIVASRWWPDHHQYRAGEIERFLRDRALPTHDLVLTTEKDAVKIERLGGIDKYSIRVVCVAIDFPEDARTILQQMLEQILRHERTPDHRDSPN